ncbi:hypothetical protein AVEN_160063-1 [Araneus ventricosus]|uniref:Uncharacterized protein n=1 Tax=Araneus ventricosus TaxID=182803 RepID=A0A4Y2FQZ9_ARAVE|nr:hypothetical protein AVEN_8502-1 [Araneus ventricosus]GBM43481.1 hypothetical protein AVEN_149972-1 [Araneus ventricosus]GBM43633.1 hypothetical protein AVEN_112637-1 [Araneus ventricosus]GBM43645.1 hypothetical protein AVEN_160063-1 [Araneus ventricosus]
MALLAQFLHAAVAWDILTHNMRAVVAWSCSRGQRSEVDGIQLLSTKYSPCIWSWCRTVMKYEHVGVKGLWGDGICYPRHLIVIQSRVKIIRVGTKKPFVYFENETYNKGNIYLADSSVRVSENNFKTIRI